MHLFIGLFIYGITEVTAISRAGTVVRYRIQKP
jgi:hypothetical protein